MMAAVNHRFASRLTGISPPPFVRVPVPGGRPFGPRSCSDRA